MSIPAFGWALEQGARLKLRPSDRLVLLFIADQANPEGLCRSASQQRIVKFTGLKRQTIHAATERLIEAQLIRVTASAGVVSRYEILRPTPPNGAGVHPAKRGHTTPSKRDRVAPSNGDGVERQNSPTYPVEMGHPPRQNGTGTPSNGDTVPCTSQVSSLKTRAPAREEGSKALSVGKKEGGTPPSAPPAPAPPPQATTTTRSDAYRRPGEEPPTDDFNSYLDAPAPTKALPCEVDQDVVRSDVPDPDGPPPPGAFKALIESIASGFQNNYPARKAQRSPSDQSDACAEKPRPKAYHPNPEQLAALRKQAGIRVTVDA